MGFVADSIGATVGAGAAFLLGRTVSFLILTLVHAPSSSGISCINVEDGALPFRYLSYAF